MAGLLAARVLSEFYDSVSVVERDRLPDYPCHRRGIPQGRHVHNSFSRGQQVFSELFPGLLEDLATAGAVVVDDGDLSNFYVRVGRYELKQSANSPIRTRWCSAWRAARFWNFTCVGA